MSHTIHNNHTAHTYADLDATDCVLLARIAQHDCHALTDLYQRYHHRLSRFLTRLTTRHELIAEIINETFWVVWQKAASFRQHSKVSTWIIGIAYRCACKALRKNKITDHTIILTEIDTSSIETFEERELLTHALAALPIEQRTVVQLTYYHGHSCEEIAAIVDCPVNTVKTRMFHARRKLKIMLLKLATVS